MNDENNDARRLPYDDGSPFGSDNHPTVERLSEYLDASDDPGTSEREAINRHLTSCQECQTALADLQLMTRTLGALPEREAPRSFAITRDMLQPAKTPEAPQPVVLQESAQWHARNAARIRWATAVAAMLFVFVISADLLTNGLSGVGTISDDAADDITSMNFEDQPEGSLGASAGDEPEPIPTTAAAQEAQVEEATEEEEAQVESAPPADAPENDPVPESDESEGSGEISDSMPASDDDAEDSDEAMSVRSMQPEDGSEDLAAEVAETSSDSTHMRWRIAEVSLALVLALLLAVMIGLPKQRGTRR